MGLQVPAGSASPSPPIGPALGQAGLNIMDFCKAFNSQTEKLEKGMPCPVVITVFQDKSFEFIVKKPPASFYIKKEVNLKKGSGHGIPFSSFSVCALNALQKSIILSPACP